MADKTVTALPAAAAMTSADLFPITQGGNSRKATGQQVINLIPSMGLFSKVDMWSVAFTLPTSSTVSLKAGTAIALPSGLVISFPSLTVVQMPSLTAGTDYAIYLCADGTVRADANFSAPTGFSTSTSRQIGGFHYAPGGNAAAQAGGDTTPVINPYSLWDLKWRPKCADPRGMALVAGAFWADIYLLGVAYTANGTSRNNVAIASGSAPPKIPLLFGGNGTTAYGELNWWDASEVMASVGKRLPRYAEFSAAVYGTTENVSRGNDPVTSGLGTTNAGSSKADNTLTSKWGIIQATGCYDVWGADLGGPYAAASWAADPASRGASYELPNGALLGGYWASGAGSGSRSSDWLLAPSTSSGVLGARGVCDHLSHV